MADSEDKILQLILQQLEASGWKSKDILRKQSTYSQQQILWLDLVLTYELYPLAIVEIERFLTPLNATINQISQNALSAGLPFAFLASDQKIVQINVLTGIITKELDKFPTPAELWTQLGRT